MNKSILIGNVGQSPELVEFDNGDKITNVSLATSIRWKDEKGEQKEKTTWHNLRFKNKLAEVAEKYIKKGDKISVVGMIDNYSYKKKDSPEDVRYATRILVSELEMLTPKNTTEQAAPPVKEQPEDDLPF